MEEPAYQEALHQVNSMLQGFDDLDAPSRRLDVLRTPGPADAGEPSAPAGGELFGPGADELISHPSHDDRGEAMLSQLHVVPSVADDATSTS